MSLTKLRGGAGALHDPDAGPQPQWGGRKAQQYVRLTLAEYGEVCVLCGLPGSTTADHVIPRSKGGAVYDLRNLQPAHKSCNESRGNNEAAGPTSVIESALDFFKA